MRRGEAARLHPHYNTVSEPLLLVGVENYYELKISKIKYVIGSPHSLCLGGRSHEAYSSSLVCHSFIRYASV